MSDLSARIGGLAADRQQLLRQLLERGGSGSTPPLESPIEHRAAEAAEVPLSPTQRGLWFMARLAPGSPFYNHASLYRLSGALDADALAWACDEVVRRHAALRTVFPAPGGRPVQQVLPAAPGVLGRIDLGGEEAGEGAGDRSDRALERAVREARRRFELETEPPLRLVLYRLAGGDHRLLRVVHHLAWDGWSAGVFDRELAALYAARRRGAPSPLPPLPIQYPDYALWHERPEVAARREADLAWWRERLTGLPDLEQPTDRPRPDRQSFDGGVLPFELDRDLAAAVDELARRAGATPFMTLLTAFQALLGRRAGGGRVPVGTPVANRGRRELEQLIGCFANVVVLAPDLSGDPSFGAALERVRGTAAGAYERQQVPFELLVQRLGVRREPGRNPLFEVMFALHNEQAAPLALDGVEVEPVALGGDTTHFDLEWRLWRRRAGGEPGRGGGAGMSGFVSFRRDLYEERTVARMIDDYRALLAAAAADPARRLSELAEPAEPAAATARAAGAAAIEALEAAALAEPAVDACRVLLRRGAAGEELVAHVVWAHAPAPAELEAALAGALPPGTPPPRLAGIDRLPLTAEGRVDDDALARLPVLDGETAERCERRLRELPGVAEAAAAAVEPDEPPPLHLSDLFGGWRAVLDDEHTSRDSAAGGELRAPAEPRPPAYADGGPLEIPPDSPATLGEALLRAAERRPERGITLVGDDPEPVHLSYPELVGRARSVLSGLRARGLGPGSRVILQLESLAEHFVAFWACVLGGVVPLTVARAAGYDRKNAVLAKLWNSWELLGRPPIVGSDRLLPLLTGVPALYGGAGDAFDLVGMGELASHPPAAELHRADPGEVVFHQLTSGSTGVPKCIQETHRGIARHVHGARAFNGMTGDDVDLNWLPFDHVVPTLTSHLKDVYLGLRQVQVRTEAVLADPLLWLELIERHRVTHSWAPNFGFKLVSDALSRAPGRRFDLSSVVYLMNAGEQITPPVVEEFLRRTAPFGIRPEAMQPAYGMAEVCTAVTYRNGFSLDRATLRVTKASLGGHLEEAPRGGKDAITFVDVGPPIPGVELRIAGTGGETLPERVIGRLLIRGGVVTPGYLHNDAANREVFVGDGWFDSGDLGFLDDGSLTITGRQKELIILRGANYYCYEIEDVVNALDGVEPTFTAACAVDDGATGTEGLAIFFVPRTPGVDAELIRAVSAAVSSQFGVVPACVLPLTRETFPKTTSGKIQRTKLRKGLAAGEFSELLREVDLAVGNQRTLPRWFLERTWRPKRPAVRERPAEGATLVLADGGGLGGALAERLAETMAGCGPVVTVRAGTGFARRGDGGFELDPRREDGFPELLAALAADGVEPARAVLLWPCDRDARGGDPEEEQAFGSLALLSLAQALAAGRHAGDGNRIRLLTAAGPAPEHAALLGLVKTLPQEWPWLACRHVELPLEDLAAEAAWLADELTVADRDREVAYRGGVRSVRRLAAVEPAPAADFDLPPDAAVVVTGGLGGVGFHLVRHLAARLGPGGRLLLLGRTPLDAPAAGGAGTGGGGAGEAGDAIAAGTSVEERRERLAGLAGLGAEVAYAAADVADAGRLAAVLAEHEARWGRRFAAAFHLAGVFPSRLLAEESRDGFAATLRPKLAGTVNLRRLLPEGAPLVVFSSINAFFGGVATGAYAAAGNLAEALCEDDRRRGGRSWCLSWSNWDEVGMSRGYRLRAQSEARGYRMIGPARGLVSCLAALGQPAPASWLIGLDPRKANVRRHLEGEARPLGELTAWVVPAPGAEPAPGSIEVADRYGVPVRCRTVTVAELPRTAAGTVDRARLAALGAGGRARRPAEPLVPPRSDSERTVAAIWREVLGVDEVGVHQSFFDLGGQSLLLAQVLSRLQQRLGRHLTMVELLRHPTIAALAEHLDEAAPAPASFDDARRRAERQRRRRPAFRQGAAVR